MGLSSTYDLFYLAGGVQRDYYQVWTSSIRGGPERPSIT